MDYVAVGLNDMNFTHRINDDWQVDDGNDSEILVPDCR